MESEAKSIKTCASCGAEIDVENDDFAEISELFYCSDCYFTCVCCENDIIGTPNYADYNGEYLCDICRDEEYVQCASCDEYYPSNDIAFTTHDGDDICPSCAADYYECARCGEYFHQDELNYLEERDASYCSYCYDRESDELEEEEEDSSEYVRGYHSRPPCGIVYHGDRYSDMLYGWEVETDDGHNIRDYASSLYGISDSARLFWMEHDGSLSGAGVEIIGQPGTITHHKSGLFEDISKIALKHGYKSHDTYTCGLHIHASWRNFGITVMEQESTCAKLILLTTKFYDEMLRISRRSRNSFERWSARYDDIHAWIPYDDIKRRGNRYSIISIRGETVELRAFKGTLKPSSFYAALEFYDSLIKLCRDIDIKTLDMLSFNEIRAFLENYNPEYLPAYFTDRLGGYDKPDISSINRTIEMRKEAEKEFFDRFNDIESEPIMPVFCKEPFEMEFFTIFPVEPIADRYQSSDHVITDWDVIRHLIPGPITAPLPSNLSVDITSFPGKKLVYHDSYPGVYVAIHGNINESGYGDWCTLKPIAPGPFITAYDLTE